MSATFPECCHRGPELSPSRYACRHPGLFVALQGVDLGTCLQCAAGGIFCNRRVTPEQQAAYDAVDAAVAAGELHSPFAIEAPKSAEHAPRSVDGFLRNPQPVSEIFRKTAYTESADRSAPSIGQQAWNLASALAAFVADGLQIVSREEYATRLHVCDRCEYRHEGRCLQCGCYISVKARGRAFSCPINRWPTAREGDRLQGTGASRSVTARPPWPTLPASVPVNADTAREGDRLQGTGDSPSVTARPPWLTLPASVPVNPDAPPPPEL